MPLNIKPPTLDQDGPVQQNCLNRDIDPFNWRSPNNSEINTAEEAQERAAMHLAVCITNPDVIRRRLERQAEIANRGQMHKLAEAQAQAANLLGAMFHQASPHNF